MTRIARLAFASLVSMALLAAAFGRSGSAQAALPYSVSVVPTAETVALGEMAIFRVKVEGDTTSLPSFHFDVEGGTLAAVASIDPTAANVAEGAVFVTREGEGTARLTVRFGSEVLATGQARFAAMGKVTINVNLDADADSAARTWRYEILSTSGQVVSTLQANTSGDAPSMSVSTPVLPRGFYTVRQVLGSDTRTACTGGAFYEVAAPVSGETTIELSGANVAVDFTIRPCPGIPDLGVIIPVDTLAPTPGFVGEAERLPGEPPISEVAGARDENPNFPLPPRVGNTPPPAETSNLLALLLVTGAAAMFLPAAAWSAVTVRGRSKR
jgi:hypothetical protein